MACTLWAAHAVLTTVVLATHGPATDANGAAREPIREEGHVVAFGSCNRQDLPQAALWDAVRSVQPGAWLWTGDAVYSKDNTLHALATALASILGILQYA